MDSLIDMLNISIADVKELGQEVDYDFTSNFSDGESDGENNFEPIAYQWFNSDYRKGYLSGIAKRIGIEDAQIYGAEMNQVFLPSCVGVGKA
jgi:hypothetical protein